MTADAVPVPVPVHDNNEIATILLVTGMIEYRNRQIAILLDRFLQDSDRLHHERRMRGLKKKADELMGLTDRIHGLAQDNAYDIRNLMVHLERKKEQGCSAGENTGHHGQVCYIQ